MRKLSKYEEWICFLTAAYFVQTFMHIDALSQIIALVWVTAMLEYMLIYIKNNGGWNI